jgi:hypothetical protein
LPPFNADAAMKVACGFHGTACLLEGILKQERLALKSIDLETINHLLGRTASMVMLEALAVELALKVRLDRAGITVARTHNHANLFELPAADRKDAEERYQARRHPAMRATLAEVLAYSAPVFEMWRYQHEHPSVEASLGEMQRAFDALAEGIPM